MRKAHSLTSKLDVIIPGALKHMSLTSHLALPVSCFLSITDCKHDSVPATAAMPFPYVRSQHLECDAKVVAQLQMCKLRISYLKFRP